LDASLAAASSAELIDAGRDNSYGVPGTWRRTPLESQLADAGPIWRKIAAKHGLSESDLGRLASAWHTDLDLGREIEVVTDMTKGRLAGFHGYQPTMVSFRDLFARLRRERIIPA
jgi:hypothetical protein